jgi:CBS domain-containing protein
MMLNEVVDRILADPRTRSAYVVDDRRRLLGMIGLNQMLKAIESSLSLFDKDRPVVRSKRGVLPFSVEEYMVKPATVYQDDKLITALRKMIDNSMEDLPVVDDDGVLLGELNGFEILLLGSEVLRRHARV